MCCQIVHLVVVFAQDVGPTQLRQIQSDVANDVSSAEDVQLDRTKNESKQNARLSCKECHLFQHFFIFTNYTCKDTCDEEHFRINRLCRQRCTLPVMSNKTCMIVYFYVYVTTGILKRLHVSLVLHLVSMCCSLRTRCRAHSTASDPIRRCE